MMVEARTGMRGNILTLTWLTPELAWSMAATLRVYLTGKTR